MKRLREVASEVGVSQKSLLRWIKAGRVEANRTLGDHNAHFRMTDAQIAKLKQLLAQRGQD